MGEEYRFSKKILEDQGIGAKEGNHIKVKLQEGVLIDAVITKIDGDEITAIEK